MRGRVCALVIVVIVGLSAFAIGACGERKVKEDYEIAIFLQMDAGTFVASAYALEDSDNYIEYMYVGKDDKASVADTLNTLIYATLSGTERFFYTVERYEQPNNPAAKLPLSKDFTLEYVPEENYIVLLHEGRVLDRLEITSSVEGMLGRMNAKRAKEFLGKHN